MSEPGPLTAAGGIALYKLGAFGVMAILAAVVVMVMTLPKSPREFTVALISTLVGSLGGGAFVVRWFEISHWAQDDAGMIAIGGVIFVCGLPAWLIVRALFAWSEAKKDRPITEIVDAVLEARKKSGL
ncbi:hypothetical protein [Pseudomonas sp. TTU2014-080ASC]|uniref:hypothetical protein n=1 Tax=Pseudomonas sp. TTU2014-080ASC TaxID=1729724 RepID=UPI00071868F7|nr:hypothetical protein [Pseudomonas sp. TTU2014-080ASC]KRW62349.1 hypothetical protein AO726_02695 [Pseudomonas sp. TTU2014-080ASC]